MLKPKGQSIAAFNLTSLISLFTLWNSSPALAVPNGKEIFKYLNPIHEKSYLNEAQDRQIKKKSFKSTGVSGSQPIPNREIGLFALVDNDKLSDAPYLDELLKCPAINGLSCLLTWKQYSHQKMFTTGER